jgi:hypothetical protein
MRTAACLVTLATLLSLAIAQTVPPGSFPLPNPPRLYPRDSLPTLTNPLVYLQPPIPFPPLVTPVCSSDWINPPPIFYQYQVPVSAGPNGAAVILSSNYTLAPFSAPPLRVEDLYIPVRMPVASFCDSRGRWVPFAAATPAAVGGYDVWVCWGKLWVFLWLRQALHRCDYPCRCIQGYEVEANIVTLNSGFTDPVTGRALPGQWLAYDGAVPGREL